MDWIASLFSSSVVRLKSGVDCKRPLHRRYAIAKPASRQSQLPGTRIGSNRSTAALRSSRSNRLMRQLERAERSEGSARLEHLEPTENDLNRHSYQTSETF